VLGPLQPVLQSKSGCDFDFSFDGGTGAAPLTSLAYRNSMGTRTAEAQQTLILNDLRSRVVLECDGQLKQVVMSLLQHYLEQRNLVLLPHL
jgi:hypothetical protein